MSLLFHKGAETRPPTLPKLGWFALIAVAAMALLLLLSGVSFHGLDRLVPAGDLFLPYFTT